MARTFDLGCSFGIMQGRLSTQTELGYQAFPWETWEDEFVSATDRGLEHIEWVLDSWRLDENPILSGTDGVIERTMETGVKVVSVCADYLMDRPLNVSDAGSWFVLRRLADQRIVLSRKAAQQLLRDDARGDVGDTARRVRHDDTNRPARIILCEQWNCRKETQRGKNCSRQ